MRGLHRLSFSWRRQCSDHKQGSGLRDLLSLYQSPFSQIVRSTTVLSVRKGDEVVVMADGQGTVGSQILKPNIKKLRRMGKGTVIGGFAGSTADALTLFEQLEMKLEAHPGQLSRAAVELAKLWRTDKYLRKLDAVMVVADKTQSLTISGNGDVVEPNDGIVAIGSGGCYALAAARALVDLPDWSAAAIADKAMQIAADCCIYTNDTFTRKSLKAEAAPKEEPLALSEEEESQ